ncbi:MAG: glycoside hydrolase family 15 protein [Gammaproteobacteria bacterium]|nr:glycoside hydrolase family 15 protein [Gammaproteobacteria bacterium]MDH3906623.1 glycoside hydrolase family 15 protein [Gammaproteobacteria bacterium]MDH4005629.1 glycoside hydrolase family 15 protein [Gammaproteobacteria bacterium]HKJ20373.1 glycoside hydrolase family 15 protein [Woeseiaceae bacterium]
MSNLNLGLVGNGQISALIDDKATVVWSCLPQFDADPTFCRLLRDDAEKDLPGFFEVEVLDYSHSEQEYITNTAILQTTLYDSNGGAVRVTDLAPRYEYVGRVFNPNMLLRRVEPLHGSPRIRIRLRPARDYGASHCKFTHGSNHIRYMCADVTCRLTTNASLTHIIDENTFVLDRELHLILGPDETIPEACGDSFFTHFRATRDYWQRFSRSLSIPFEWQDAVIRAAITLKLCTFEDTGAVVAALTTSIPEAADSGRNWDYRFCWLRDSYFVVQALNRLGATTTMMRYLSYIMNIVADASGEPLKPLYGISGSSLTDEKVVESLSGYRGMGPVRRGNQAFEQVQHDVYGAVVLSATQFFFDNRLIKSGTEAEFQRLEVLGEHARRFYNQPDAGLWEYRGRQRVHTFSSIMCWAACDRLSKIAVKLGKDDRAAYWRTSADDIRAFIIEGAWDEEQNAFTESFGRPEMDASLLTMHDLGFLEADDPKFISTVECIGKHLQRGEHMFRYDAPDDFGEPENAFNICTFWYIDALASIGRMDEARALFENMLTLRNPLGLLSEDIEPKSGELWGNLPQTYSMAGIINAAVRLSKTWEEAL